MGRGGAGRNHQANAAIMGPPDKPGDDDQNRENVRVTNLVRPERPAQVEDAAAIDVVDARIAGVAGQGQDAVHDLRS